MNRIEQLLGIKYSDINQFLIKAGTNLMLCVIILVAGFWFSNMLSRGLKRLLRKSNTDEGLITFMSSFISMVLKILVTVSAVSQLGIEMTSFVALLGAAGLAIGMAFSGTLSNFAGGIMILVLKPFKVGDTILTQGEQGVVKEIQIFNTYLYTVDNKVIILPNGPIANGNITNFTKAKNRRVDWSFSISFGDNYELAKNLIEKFIIEDKRILKNPPHFIGVSQLTSSAVGIVVRAWVNTDDFSDVFFQLNEFVYREFERAGLHAPHSLLEMNVKTGQS